MKFLEQDQLYQLLLQYEQYIEQNADLLTYKNEHGESVFTYQKVGTGLNGVDKVKELLSLTKRYEQEKERQHHLSSLNADQFLTLAEQVQTFNELNELGFVYDGERSFRISAWKHEKLVFPLLFIDQGNGYAQYKGLEE